MKAARRHLLFKHWLLPLLVLTNVFLAAYIYALHETPWAWLSASLERDGPLSSSEYLSFAQFVLIAATIDHFFKAAVSRFNRRSKRYHIPKLVVDIQSILAYALTGLGAALLLFDLPIKSFFAASGAITLVVAYASREWVSDITASIQIQTTRLAHIDDWLRFQEGDLSITSKVIDLDQQLVTLRDKNGTVRKIRNSRFLQMPFVNLSLNPEGAVRSLQFRLSSSLPEIKILAILENVMSYVAQVFEIHTRHLCLVSSIFDGEIEYSIEYRCPAQIAVNVSRHQIMQTAARFFRCANIQLRSQHLQLSAAQRLSDPQHGPLSYLKNCQNYGVLHLLDPDALAILAKDASMKFLSAGELLLAKGQVGDFFYIVSEGCLEVQIEGSHNHSVTMALVWPGECVGEMSLLTGEPYSATVVARADTHLIAVPKEAFAELFTHNLALVDTLSKVMLQRKARNQELLSSRDITNHASTSLSERIFKWFGLVRGSHKVACKDVVDHEHMVAIHPTAQVKD